MLELRVVRSLVSGATCESLLLECSLISGKMFEDLDIVLPHIGVVLFLERSLNFQLAISQICDEYKRIKEAGVLLLHCVLKKIRRTIV